MKNTLLSTFSVSLLAAALQAATFTDVSIRQRWPWSQKIDITYTLVSDETQRVSVAFTANGAKLTIPPCAFSGDIWEVAPGGPRTITVDPAKTAYTNQIMFNMKATLSAGATPLYMIIDLTKKPTEDGQTTYLMAYDITNGVAEHNGWEYGSHYHTGPYIDSRWQDTVIWTGVTNNLAYKTTSLVLRYIPSGTFTMGSAPDEPGYAAARELRHNVTLTKGMYAGIYEITKAQYALIMDKPSSTATTPQNSFSHDTLRGCWTNEQGVSQYDWPSNDHAVASDSFLGMLRAKTGIGTFDLPTSAQWEYACRAGATGSWHNGYTITNETVDAEAGKVGWYSKNSSSYQQVGLLWPNGWGCYDMQGNIRECCLDWAYTVTAADAVDPKGPWASSSKMRPIRGGFYGSGSAKTFRLGALDFRDVNNTTYGDGGCRVFMNLE